METHSEWNVMRSPYSDSIERHSSCCAWNATRERGTLLDCSPPRGVIPVSGNDAKMLVAFSAA